jgi:site-specific DNA-methyltransferase (adenine-specific)
MDYKSENVWLMQGDCLERMKEIPDGSIDAIIADPPYGTTACKWDSVIPFEPMWEQLNRIIKPNGAIVLFGSEPFSSALRMSNIKHYKYDWVWEKERPTNIFTIKNMAGKVHENISVFYFSLPTYNPIMENSIQQNNNNGNKSQSGDMNAIEAFGKTKTSISKDYNSKKRYPRSVIRIPRGTRGNKKFHPTQKPVALMEYLIKTYTNEGETVLDFTMGSGTTGVACVNTNRNFIGIELDEGYFKIAQDRINQAVVNINKQDSL